MEEKIKTLEEISDIISNLKQQGKKIVQCHGVFDLVHYGHIRHFLAAKEKGDILVVTITPDKFIQKGPERPFFNEEIRLKHLSAIQCIDYVVLNRWPTAIETIKIIKPDVYAKGKEVLSNKEVDLVKKGRSNLAVEKEAVESVSGKLYLTDEITFSSSKIINQITSSLPEETKEFLNNFRKNFNAETILKILDSLKNLNVLVIGDTIIDEYIYSKNLDITSKDPIIAYQYLNSETFLGGVLATANHLSGFAGNVELITCVGKENYDYINENLNKKIDGKIFTQDSKTITKRRYIEDYSKIKIFEIYNIDEFKISDENEQKILSYLKENLYKFDLIIINDFGHGLLSENLIDFFCKNNKFLAINCQLNAGNMGYNFITKYKRADFISLNEREIRLPFQNKTKDIQTSIIKLRNSLNLEKINITLGKAGSIYYKGDANYPVPAFTKEPLDTLGAGDAVFSLTSLLAYKNVNSEIIPFLGNCVGAITVRIIGNKKAISPIDLKKFVAYVLK